MCSDMQFHAAGNCVLQPSSQHSTVTSYVRMCQPSLRVTGHRWLLFLCSAAHADLARANHAIKSGTPQLWCN